MRRAFAGLAAEAATRAAGRTRLRAAVLRLGHSAALRALEAWRGLAAAKSHRRRQVGGANVLLVRGSLTKWHANVERGPAGWTSSLVVAVWSTY